MTGVDPRALPSGLITGPAPTLSLRELAPWFGLAVLAAVVATLGAAVTRPLNAFVPAGCAFLASVAVAGGVRRAGLRKAGAEPALTGPPRSVGSRRVAGFAVAGVLLLVLVPVTTVAVVKGVTCRYPLWFDFAMALVVAGGPLVPSAVATLGRGD